VPDVVVTLMVPHNHPQEEQVVRGVFFVVFVFMLFSPLFVFLIMYTSYQINRNDQAKSSYFIKFFLPL